MQRTSRAALGLPPRGCGAISAVTLLRRVSSVLGGEPNWPQLDLHVDDHQGDDPWTSGRHAATSWTDGAFVHFALYETKDGSTTAGAQVAFRVDNLDIAQRRAIEAGAEVVHAPKLQPWGRSSRYADPDGNVIELTQAD